LPDLIEVDALLINFGDPDIADRLPPVLTASVAASSHEVLLVPMMSMCYRTAQSRGMQ
jgi:hypothetical protein